MINIINNLIAISNYSHYVKETKKPITQKSIFFETKQGSIPTKQILDYLKVITKSYPKEFHCYLSVTKENKAKIIHILKENELFHVITVPYMTRQYFKLLATANYLYNDSSFPVGFIKRKQQVYLYDSTIYLSEYAYSILENTGNNIIVPKRLLNHIGREQKELLSSDFILCNNNTDFHALCKVFFLDKLYQGKLLYQKVNDFINNKPLDISCMESIIDSFLLKEDLLHVDRFFTVNAKSNKKNVLIFCSDLRRNGMTTSLLNLISLVDKDKTNYFFTYQEELFSSHAFRLDSLPFHTYLVPISGNLTIGTLMERICHSLYFRFQMDIPWIRRHVHQIYQRAYKAHFGTCHFHEVIHFTGYAPDFALLFQHANAKRAIIVHNDMYEEYQEKKNFHLPTLIHAYEKYDKVVAVSQAVKDSIQKLFKSKRNLFPDTIAILENAHDHKGVLAKSLKPFAMDHETELSTTFDELKKLLASSKKKFITIGRFSKEKGHKKLINAFANFHLLHPETVLFIIGGYGPIFTELIAYKNTLSCKDSIVIIKSIANPFAILKQCDLFLLPSDREPLGLVLLEADTLSIPIVATDIPGSGDFLRRYHGFLVENSEGGLLEGMNAFLEGKVKPLYIPFEEYNKEIVQKFENLFE